MDILTIFHELYQWEVLIGWLIQVKCKVIRTYKQIKNYKKYDWCYAHEYVSTWGNPWHTVEFVFYKWVGVFKSRLSNIQDKIWLLEWIRKLWYLPVTVQLNVPVSGSKLPPTLLKTTCHLRMRGPFSAKTLVVLAAEKATLCLLDEGHAQSPLSPFGPESPVSPLWPAGQKIKPNYWVNVWWRESFLIQIHFETREIIHSRYFDLYQRFCSLRLLAVKSTWQAVSSNDESLSIYWVNVFSQRWVPVGWVVGLRVVEDIHLERHESSCELLKVGNKASQSVAHVSNYYDAWSIRPYCKWHNVFHLYKMTLIAYLDCQVVRLLRRYLVTQSSRAFQPVLGSQGNRHLPYFL